MEHNNSSLGKSRDLSYDILRWLALTGIILVHSKPTLFWAQIRSFDVPLMVLVSAICFTGSEGGGKIKEYYKKRFVRLILPSWVFLTAYFTICYFIGVEISIKKVFMCYTLTTGWYFWIIRILVVMAIIAPWLIKYTRGIKRQQLLWICVLLLLLTEVLANVSDNYFYKIVVMCMPYMVYYILGINLSRFSRKNVEYAGCFLIALYMIIAACLYINAGEYIPTSKFKYPPQIYYTSYALGLSAFLYLCRNRIVIALRSIGLLDFAAFVGSHTFWIYLWHIPMVDYMSIRYDAPVTFFTVYFSSILITYMQTILVNRICTSVENPTFRKNLKMVFIG